MDDGDGALAMELQAFKIAQNATMYKGSRPCPQCGVVMSPTEYMYNVLCAPCLGARSKARLKGRLS